MIETICENCGNRKSFDDQHAGKTFKCPSCSQPVVIQNLGSQLQAAPSSQTNSFAEEIARAEELRREQEEENRRQAVIQANEKRIKNYLYWGIGTIVCGIIWVKDRDTIHIGVGSIVLGIWLLIQRGKLQKGEE